MKKALVLGVLAIFAISIANVNAQDRTNVQEKAKKTYNQEPATKKGETKSINQGVKKQDPTAKQVTGAKEGQKKIQGTKGGNKVAKNKAMNDAAKKQTTAKKQTDVNATTTEVGKNAKAEKQAVESENAGKEVKGANVTGKNVTGKANSVPPTKKEKKAESGNVTTTK